MNQSIGMMRVNELNVKSMAAAGDINSVIGEANDMVGGFELKDLIGIR